MPLNIDQNEWLHIAKEFEDLWNFNHCIGAIDGKHIIIQVCEEFYHICNFCCEIKSISVNYVLIMLAPLIIIIKIAIVLCFWLFVTLNIDLLLLILVHMDDVVRGERFLYETKISKK